MNHPTNQAINSKLQSGEIALRNEQAASYAVDYQRTKGPWWDNLEKTLLVKGARARKGMRILDAGCGVGRLTFALAHIGCQVESLDFSPESIRILRNSHPELQHRIRAIVHDTVDPLPFADGSIDGVVSCQVVQHIPTREARSIAWANMARVTKPGGRLATIVYHLIHSLSIEGWFNEQLFYHRYTPEDLSVELSEAGWTPLSMSVWYRRSWKNWPPPLAAGIEQLFSKFHLMDDRGIYLLATACRV